MAKGTDDATQHEKKKDKVESNPKIRRSSDRHFLTEKMSQRVEAGK